MTELEKKMLLTKEEYDYLLKIFGYDTSPKRKSLVKQINYYFDTDSLSMNQKNTTCRIRLKDGIYKGTMKQHATNTDHSTETNVEVRNGLYDNAFIDMGLKLQGELITERCVILKDSNFEVVLDKNEYLGHTDYELEIEYTSKHEKDAQAILIAFCEILMRRKFFLAYKEIHTNTPNVPSKSSRFFDRKTINDPKIQKKTKLIEKKDYSKHLKTDSVSSYGKLNMFDYPNYEDYMNDYYDSIMPGETGCMFCIHFKGTSCEFSYGKCEYEHN